MPTPRQGMKEGAKGKTSQGGKMEGPGRYYKRSRRRERRRKKKWINYKRREERRKGGEKKEEKREATWIGRDKHALR